MCGVAFSGDRSLISGDRFSLERRSILTIILCFHLVSKLKTHLNLPGAEIGSWGNGDWSIQEQRLNFFLVSRFSAVQAVGRQIRGGSNDSNSYFTAESWQL